MANKLSLQQKKYIAGNYLFLVPFLIFFIVFTLGPIFYAVFMSFHKWPILAKTHPFIGLENYKLLMNDDIWWQSLRNTLFFAVLTAISTTIFSFLVADAINKPIKGQNIYRFIFYTPVVFSVAAMSIVMSWAFNTQFGIINAILSTFGIPQINWLGSAKLVIPTISLASIWWGFGGPMLIFLAALQNIPVSVYEAAKIAGAKVHQVFFKITVPLMAPAILFIIITQFIAHLQVFGQPYLMTSGGGPGRSSYTAILYLYHTAWRYYRMGYGTSIAISLALIILVITSIQLIIGSRKSRVEY